MLLLLLLLFSSLLLSTTTSTTTTMNAVESYAALEARMNDWRSCPTATLVRVNSLRLAGQEFDQLKEGAESKRKSYR